MADLQTMLDDYEPDEVRLARIRLEHREQVLHETGECDSRVCRICISLEMQREYQREVMDDYNQSRM
jgi:hypothetical protein